MSSTAAQHNNVPRAVFSIVLAVLALSLGDAIVKLISVNFPLWQLYVLRSAITLPFLLFLIWWFRSKQPPQVLSGRWVVLRSLLLAVMWVAYYLALPHIQFSVAAAGFYTAPLFITLISAPLTGDRVGVKGWLAVMLGFAGVLVMLRPDVGGFNAYALLPILAAVLYASAMVMTRTKCQNENPFVLSAALNAMFIVFGLVATAFLWAANPNPDIVAQNTFLLGHWRSIGVADFGALVVLAASILMGSLFAAIAYQSAASSTVATFDYSYLVFGVVWGIVFFAEVPDTLTSLGIFMIAVAGIIAVRR